MNMNKTNFIVPFLVTTMLSLSVAHSENPESKNVAILRQLDFYNEGHLTDVEVYAGLVNQLLQERRKKEPHVAQLNLDALRKRASKGYSITMQDIGIDVNGDLDLPWSYFPKSDLPLLVAEHDDIVAKAGSSSYYAFDKLDPKDFGLAPLAPSGGAPPLPITPPVPATTAGSPIYTVEKPGIHLNRSVSDLVTGSSIPQQSAVFSYAKNVDTGHDQFGAQGTLAADIPVYITEASPPAGVSPFLTQFDFTPSVSFEKVTGQKDPTNDQDSLTGELALQNVLPLASPASSPDTVVGLNQTVAFDYGTDFELEQKAVGGRYDVIPLCPLVALGGMTPMFPGAPVKVGVLLDFRLEGGDVLHVGKSSSLKSTEAYLRLGPNVGLTFQPSDDTRYHFLGGSFSFAPSDLTLSANYQYYFQEVGINGDVSIFDTSLEYAINGSKNLSFRAEFQNGKTDILLQRRNQFTTGIALKF